jgi:hypothetical protein
MQRRNSMSAEEKKPTRAEQWGRKGSIIGAFFGTPYGYSVGMKTVAAQASYRNIRIAAYTLAGYGAGVAWGLGIGFWAEMFARKENITIPKAVVENDNNNDNKPWSFK